MHVVSVEHAGHSHMTFGVVEKSSDGGYALKPLKQKQMVDGLCYLLQEIYGIENKNNERGKVILNLILRILWWESAGRV